MGREAEAVSLITDQHGVMSYPTSLQSSSSKMCNRQACNLLTPAICQPDIHISWSQRCNNIEDTFCSLQITLQCYRLSQFVGAFAKLHKATISSAMSVRLSVRWNNSASSERVFLEIWYLSISLKYLENVQVSLKSDKSNGYFTWSWSIMYIFYHILLISS
jgi:hypothetical protein